MSHDESQEDLPVSAPEEKKRKLSLEGVMRDLMKPECVKRWAEPVLEPLLRKVVKEEIDFALKRHFTSVTWDDERETESFHSRNLILKFSSNFSFPIFTGARIEGENSIAIFLLDCVTREVLHSGPESSANVELVVLEGDFDADDNDNWTPEDFENSIVQAREGKKPLLSGDVLLKLKEGYALVGEVSFTDNSSWTRSRKFRLGARVLDRFDHTRIIEAKTEPFVVRDHRGELYKKHHPPSLFDEVWRLEKIGKDGAFHKRLTGENITTVKDFLTLLTVEPSKLRHILGSGMSTKMWEVTVDHARTCMLDKKVFLHYPESHQKHQGVVFNVVGQVLGVLMDSQYVPIDKLSETEKDDARKSVIDAFQRWENVITVEDESYLQNCNRYEFSEPPGETLPEEDLGLIYDYSLVCEGDDPILAGVDSHHVLFSADVASEQLSMAASSGVSKSATKSVAQKRWKKVSNVIKWFYIRKVVALKRARIAY